MLNKKFLLLYNHDLFAYNFTYEIIEELLKKNAQVVLSCPYGEKINDFIKLGVIYEKTDIDRRGSSVFKDIKLYNNYKKLIKKYKPSIIFGFTIKPNIYGALAAKKYKVPFIARVTGLGSAFQSKNIIYKITKYLYRKSFKTIEHVFFENQSNAQVFNKDIISLRSFSVIPGSGVNISKFSPVQYKNNEKVTKYLYLGRIMREKGVDEFFEASKYLKKQYKDSIEFHVAGFYEDNYKEIVENLSKDGSIIYHGFSINPSQLISTMQCLVLPSYHEGMSNVMLEAQALGIPVIGTNIPGVKETFVDKKSGFLVNVKDWVDLKDKIVDFYSLSPREKNIFSINARNYVYQRFDRKIVVNKYLEIVDNIIKEQ